MSEPTLSERERRILAEIERDLSADRRLNRALRTMRRGLPRWASRAGSALVGLPYLVLALLLALSTALLLTTAQIHTGLALALFAAVWAPTLLAVGARTAHRWRTRRIR
ncbi:DUF3040 domain-containing protein [Kitasatospora sp. NPDC048365]|uniref:DUF3040 domain-containing protein n=1 Tax=Kitasatospora sp. NPDC048365 TaxID=3364050 RepID=UPI0037187FBC